jgi:hypothetical protein
MKRTIAMVACIASLGFAASGVLKWRKVQVRAL